MKKLPIDVSDIETMITGDYIYVDKTKQIYDLITGGRLYFLSRPRRFGKSLLISTLRAIFSGKKTLFENLWIGKSSYDWVEHPVLHLDFSGLSYASAEAFIADLSWTLENIAHSYGISIEEAPSLVIKLKALVTKLATRGKVVVLIDEYDFPLLRTLHAKEKALPLRDTLSSFFAALKSLDSAGCIQGVFITGVTKFAKTSLFSGMNNLNDISLDFAAADLLGCTEEEIRTFFKEPISHFSQVKGISEKAIFEEMKTWYNGYSFTENPEAPKVYNPFSILYFLHKQKLENYWFESATPTFLVELLKSNAYEEDWKEEIALENIVVSRKSFGAFEVDGTLPLYPLLYQTGYLTIKAYDPELKAYTLGYPNEEVKLSLTTYLMAIAAHIDDEKVNTVVFALLKALDSNDLDVFFHQLQSLFGSIPYDLHIQKEGYYHSLFHMLTTLLGLEVQSEVHTSIGRIDLSLVTKKRVFIFEFKFNSTGQEAMQQIEDQRYFEKYRLNNKPITLAGISFNYDAKKLTLDWVKKEIK